MLRFRKPIGAEKARLSGSCSSLCDVRWNGFPKIQLVFIRRHTGPRMTLRSRHVRPSMNAYTSVLSNSRRSRMVFHPSHAVELEQTWNDSSHAVLDYELSQVVNQRIRRIDLEVLRSQSECDSRASRTRVSSGKHVDRTITDHQGAVTSCL